MTMSVFTEKSREKAGVRRRRFLKFLRDLPVPKCGRCGSELEFSDKDQMAWHCPKCMAPAAPGLVMPVENVVRAGP